MEIEDSSISQPTRLFKKKKQKRPFSKESLEGNKEKTKNIGKKEKKKKFLTKNLEY